MNTDHLSIKEVAEMTDLLCEYSSIFQLEGDSPGFYTGVKHEIHTGNHVPIRSRPYRTSPCIQEEIRKQVRNTELHVDIDVSVSRFGKINYQNMSTSLFQ